MIWQKQIMFAPNGHYDECVIFHGNELQSCCQDQCVLANMITVP